MLYWGLADYLSIAIIALYAASIYFAYSLTRITGGAPTAWYVIIAALVLLLLRRAVELYYDLQAPLSLSDTEEIVLSFFVALFFSTGLYMLLRTFRRQLSLALVSRTQP